MTYGNSATCGRCFQPITDISKAAYDFGRIWHVRCLAEGERQLRMAATVLERRADDFMPYDENEITWKR